MRIGGLAALVGVALCLLVLRAWSIQILHGPQTIGGVVATRRPHNPIGWLCILAGLMMACSMLASEYANGSVLAQPGSPPPGAAWVAWIGNLLAAWIAVIVPIILFFPDGKLPGRRWAMVLWAEAGTLLLAFLGRLGCLERAGFGDCGVTDQEATAGAVASGLTA